MKRAERAERISHRGAKRELPENTVAAFQRAFERGADAIELDVHTTRDGVVMVHHDPAVHVLGGRALEIAGTSWSELRSIELAPGIGVPTLAEVFEITPATATVYIEIKGAGIEDAVIAEVRRSPARCALHSFDHAMIGRIARTAPGIPRGVLFERTPKDLEALLDVTGARDVWPEFRLIDQVLIERVHAIGRRVIAWTVNSADVAADLDALGVDGLCTDDVRLLDGL